MFISRFFSGSTIFVFKVTRWLLELLAIEVSALIFIFSSRTNNTDVCNMICFSFHSLSFRYLPKRAHVKLMRSLSSLRQVVKTFQAKSVEKTLALVSIQDGGQSITDNNLYCDTFGDTLAVFNRDVRISVGIAQLLHLGLWRVKVMSSIEPHFKWSSIIKKGKFALVWGVRIFNLDIVW